MDTSEYKKLYESDTGDVTILLSDGEKKVISHILCHISPVFRAALNGKMKESTEKVFDMTKYNSQVVDYALRFIYYKEDEEFILNHNLD